MDSLVKSMRFFIFKQVLYDANFWLTLIGLNKKWKVISNGTAEKLFQKVLLNTCNKCFGWEIRFFLLATLNLRRLCFQKLLLVYKFSCVSKNGHFVKELYCCMNNLYFSHRSLYAPTNCFWVLSSMLIIHFWVTSWFHSVCNIVAYWVNIR